VLVLFDVDATLITTSRAGIWAMGAAGRELYGEAFTTDRTEFSGRLDPLILRDLLEANGVEPTAAALAAMRATYRVHLERRLREGPPPRALPGVMDLLTVLSEQASVVMGLLTGNFPETGAMKLRACGIEPERFPIRVWGDESPFEPPCREHLPPVAIGRYRERQGREVAPDAVTVVGDTPHDVACAKANGCRVIGVATGAYSTGALRDAGADLVLVDLSDTERVVSWVMRRA